MHLPQRAVLVQGATRQVSHERSQLGGAAGRGKAGAAQVMVDLEVGILHPHGVMQTEGHSHHTPSQWWDEMDALVHDVA